PAELAGRQILHEGAMLAARVIPLEDLRLTRRPPILVEPFQRHDAPPIVPGREAIALLRLLDDLAARERVRIARREKQQSGPGGGDAHERHRRGRQGPRRGRPPYAPPHRALSLAPWNSTRRCWKSCASSEGGGPSPVAATARTAASAASSNAGSPDDSAMRTSCTAPSAAMPKST